MKIRHLTKFAALAVAALSFTFVACSDNDNGDSESDASDTPVPTTEEAESPDTETATTQEARSPSPEATDAPGSASPGAVGSRDDDLATATFALSWQDAVAQAQQRSQGDLHSIELDRDDGRYVYTVDLVSGTEEYEVEIDANTGEILDEETDDDDDDVDEVVDVIRVIPLQEALDAALAARNGRVDEWKLEATSSGAHFEFDIDTPGDDDVDVYVDAYTGEVLRVTDD